MRLAIALLLCSCDRTEPIARCTDDLAGVYEVENTTARWHVLDNRVAIEAYPLFADAGSGETAPRVLDLRRTPGGDALAGEVTRRFMQGKHRCDAKASARITSCANNTLEIVLADPLPPLQFEPCTWGQTAPSRRERWRRVR